MKIIALMPVKNDAWILPMSLTALSQICDVIIIADQMSDDGSREIYKDFPKVVTFDNHNSTPYFDLVRKDLLDVARGYDGNNLLLCVDADEVIPPASFHAFIRGSGGLMSVGTSFSFQWIQLWKSIHFYNNCGSWLDFWKPIAWLDDRAIEYPKDFASRHHMGAIPVFNNSLNVKIEHVPLLHFQWVAWDRTQMKQTWYRCTELIDDPKAAVGINAKYSITFEAPDTKLTPVPKEWTDGLQIPEGIEKLPGSWHYQEIIRWFDKYGIKFFEPLQIWHIAPLREEFIKRVRREPKSILRDSFFRRVQNRMYRGWGKIKNMAGKILNEPR